MRNRFNLWNLATFLSLVLFFSCKKDDNPSSNPPPQPPTLFEKVQGRWDVDVPVWRKQANPSRASLKNQEKLSEAEVTSVEFLSDSTCIITLNYYYAIINTISVSDSITFNMPELGPLNNIRVVDDSLSFSFTYYDIPMTVRAAKKTNLQVNEDKKALLKTWKMTTEEDGADFYEENEIDGDFQVVISTAGSFVLQYPNRYAESLNWKWHPEETDAFVTYSAGENDNTNHYFKILELNNTKLKLQEIYLEPTYGEDANGNEFITGYEKVIANTFVLNAK